MDETIVKKTRTKRPDISECACGTKFTRGFSAQNPIRTRLKVCGYCEICLTRGFNVDECCHVYISDSESESESENDHVPFPPIYLNRRRVDDKDELVFENDGKLEPITKDEEKGRFTVCRADSRIKYARGQWVCMDFKEDEVTEIRCNCKGSCLCGLLRKIGPNCRIVTKDGVDGIEEVSLNEFNDDEADDESSVSGHVVMEKTESQAMREESVVSRAITSVEHLSSVITEDGIVTVPSSGPSSKTSFCRKKSHNSEPFYNKPPPAHSNPSVSLTASDIYIPNAHSCNEIDLPREHMGILDLSYRKKTSKHVKDEYKIFKITKTSIDSIKESDKVILSNNSDKKSDTKVSLSDKCKKKCAKDTLSGNSNKKNDKKISLSDKCKNKCSKDSLSNNSDKKVSSSDKCKKIRDQDSLSGNSGKKCNKQISSSDKCKKTRDQVSLSGNSDKKVPKTDKCKKTSDKVFQSDNSHKKVPKTDKDKCDKKSNKCEKNKKVKNVENDKTSLKDECQKTSSTNRSKSYSKNSCKSTKDGKIKLIKFTGINSLNPDHMTEEEIQETILSGRQQINESNMSKPLKFAAIRNLCLSYGMSEKNMNLQVMDEICNKVDLYESHNNMNDGGAINDSLIKEVCDHHSKKYFADIKERQNRERTIKIEKENERLFYIEKEKEKKREEQRVALEKENEKLIRLAKHKENRRFFEKKLSLASITSVHTQQDDQSCNIGYRCNIPSGGVRPFNSGFRAPGMSRVPIDRPLYYYDIESMVNSRVASIVSGIKHQLVECLMSDFQQMHESNVQLKKQHDIITRENLFLRSHLSQEVLDKLKHLEPPEDSNDC